MKLILSCCIFLFFSSCMGYQMGDIIPQQTISIPIFKNETLYRGYEFLLTNSLHKEILTQTSLQITNANVASTVLKGTILAIRQRTVEKDENKRAVRLDVHVKVQVEWLDKVTNKPILPITTISDTVEVMVAQGESTDSAITQGLSKIARHIIYHMEHPYWNDPYKKDNISTENLGDSSDEGDLGKDLYWDQRYKD